MKTLSDAFEHTLQDIYYAENALTKALPKVHEAANGTKLKKAVADHLEETKDQIKVLEKAKKPLQIILGVFLGNKFDFSSYNFNYVFKKSKS